MNAPLTPQPTLAISVSHADGICDDVIAQYYTDNFITPIAQTTLVYISELINTGLTLPDYADLDSEIWQSKDKVLDIYITDMQEGRQLNLDARGKDYATNILSYPSDLPTSLIEVMPELPLGELIICHDVLITQADEQGKTTEQHLTHLLVHGILHLLGFDHELGQTEQDEMEGFEIEILANLGLPNPYE
ncbi:rRNA maturation RNase YbeY [Psychrobacter sp. I-STPA10]|uniref:rRNA maturation RNase YbeY n=1 Tax=Psychrobacter sp. I-STPA10 TaxID=2585769 RepID=UPI001E4D8A39|nr:rRNA maturation RNase YbeY [Psychrobacter sp. I-STPA10]